MAGLIGFASVLTLDGFTWGVLGEISGRPGVDQRTVQLALDEVQNSAWSLPYYLTALGYIFGLLVLAVGAARSGLIAPVAARSAGRRRAHDRHRDDDRVERRTSSPAPR